MARGGYAAAGKAGDLRERAGWVRLCPRREQRPGAPAAALVPSETTQICFSRDRLTAVPLLLLSSEVPGAQHSAVLGTQN